LGIDKTKLFKKWNFEYF